MTKKLKILLFDFNNVLIDVARELEVRGHELIPFYVNGKLNDWKQADVIVVWNETDIGGWRDWIDEAKKLGKRVVLMQHGHRGTSRIFPPFNEELKSDLVCAWGENDRQRLESCGVDPTRIRVTGTAVFNHLLPRIPHPEKNVVFSPEHWDIDVAENFIINSMLNKLEGPTVITKALEGEHTIGVYQNVVWSDRKKEGHLDVCAKVLQTADLVVAVSESTFELMAQIMDIPVVIADIWTPKACNGDERYRDYHREYSNACTKVPLNKLNETILYQLAHPEVLREERKQIAILDGGRDIADPVSEIIKVIEEV